MAFPIGMMRKDEPFFNFDSLKLFSPFTLTTYFNNNLFIPMFHEEIRGLGPPLRL